MLALLPAALVLLFGWWSGSFAAGASGWGALAGHVALLGAAFLARDVWSDPLRLGDRGRFLPIGLWTAVAVSCLLSPVSRAGRLGVLLLPAFLFVPAIVERCWNGPEARRRGLAGLAAVVALVALRGLLDRPLFDAPRAAMPLGHHNLLAGYLVALLPLVVLGLRESGWQRWLSGVAALLAVGAIAASGSLLAAVALAVQAILLVLWRVGWHRLLLPTALLVLALQMPRLVAMISGQDVSTQARLVYLDAGWEGLKLKPWLGWGPGSVPWTLAEFLHPKPGINPPSEVVGDLHSLPMQILYELGAIGFVFTLGTAAFFLRRRITERPSSADSAALAAGLIGLLGAAVTRLGGASLSVTALPLTVGIAAGCALSAGARTPGADRRRSPWPIAVYVAIVALALAPVDLAELRYDQARSAAAAGDNDGAIAELRAAHDLDPSFPAYSARLGGMVSGHAGARFAREAAESAVGVSALWLACGDREADEDSPWAREAFLRAARLDPLGALAPFRAAVEAPAALDAPDLAARALLGEPRLLAARFWREQPQLRAAAVAKISGMADIDAGWRVAFAAAAKDLPSSQAPSDWLGLEMDGEPYLAVSLHVFRRQPWVWTLAPVELDANLAGRIALTAALRTDAPKPAPDSAP